MNNSTVEKRIAKGAAVFLYALGAGMLLVMAVNAAVISFYPSPPYPVGGFPVYSVKEDCEAASGTWQGANLAVEGGYCLTAEEQARNAQVDQYSLAARVAGVAAGAVALIAALGLTRAGMLVRLGLGAGAVMLLASVSGMPLLFVTVSSQSAYVTTFAGSGNIAVPRWEAALAVIAWLLVLWSGNHVEKSLARSEV